MGYYPIKLRATDTNYSRYIREKAGQKCEICKPSDVNPDAKLECAHFHSRRHEITRFDDSNCYALCFNHHKQSHDSDDTTFKDFVYNKLGKKKFELLEFLHNQTKKRDDFIDKLIIKEKLKSVGLEWK